MNFVRHVELWVHRRQSSAQQADVLRVSRSEDPSPKPSIHVAAQGAGRFVEISVWASGEAEFAFGELEGWQSDEHHDLTDLFELDQLLERFLARLQDLHG